MLLRGEPGQLADSVSRDALHVIVQLEPQEIVYLTQILEGYGHIGIQTTYDEEWGIVELSVPPDLRVTALEILEALRQEIPLSIISIQ